ncbi:MAG: nucleic acid-binding protein [Planctomycetes bacterium]|nr:nucleic acid-binding protein [Planctomycetota bacterium]
MSAVVFDTTPLGILCHPRNPAPVMACRQWVGDLLAAGRRVIVPEIADYEVRGELIRINSSIALSLLDQLGVRLDYLPMTTAAMRLAANLWAQARSAGYATAPDHALDADVIVAAQALSLNTSVIVATGNPAHLNRFVPADLWSNITP